MRPFTDYGMTLTVGEILEKLKRYPLDLPVIIEGSHGSGPAVSIEFHEQVGIERYQIPAHLEIKRYQDN